MLTTVKHFPGHGDTATDSHLGVASVNGDRAHLDSIELPPFRQAIAAGVDSVMVAHVTVPALDSDPNHVATISPAVVSDLLEKQLGFKGLIVTDALDMAGLTHLFANDIGRAAVEAFKAGNDLLIIPADFRASYESMLKAVRSGEISQERLDHSVLKILKIKGALGLNKSRTVDISAIATVVGKPENIAFGQQVAELRHHPGARQRQSAAPEIQGNSQGRPSVYDQRGDAQPGRGRAFFGRCANGFGPRVWPRVPQPHP